MADVDIKRFDEADELRTFEHGTFELVTIGGVTVGRARYEPGWVWSEHVGLVVSGRCAVKMTDGTDYELTPGDLFHVAAGHDSWVIGDEPYISLHFLGATDYAKR